MTSCTKHFKKWLMLLATILVVQVAAKAQIVVQGYGQLNAQPDGAYTVCGAPETDTINLKNTNGGNISAINITLHLPPGGSYVAGSIMASGTGVTGAVDATISNLNAPVITVNGSVASNNTFKIWYKKTFTCPVIAFQAGTGHLTQETLDFSYTGGAAQTGLTTVGTYSVVAASLNLTTVTNQAYTGLVGDTYTQTYTMVNGGQGCTSTAYLVLDNGAGTYSFSAPTSGTLSHDTLFFAPADMPGGDLKWCNGETKTVTVTTKILNCNQLLRNSIVGWGCGAGSYCQPTTASNSHNSNVTITNAIPNLSFSVPNPDYNYCYTGDTKMQRIRIINTGTGPATNISIFLIAGNGNTFFDSTTAWNVKDKNGNIIGQMKNFTNVVPYDVENSSCGLSRVMYSAIGKLPNVLVPANDTIYVEIQTFAKNYNCISNLCNNILYWSEVSGGMSYQNQCGTGNYTIGAMSGYSGLGLFSRAYEYFLATNTTPTDISGTAPNNTFNITVNYSVLSTTAHPNNKGTTYFILPNLSTLSMQPTATSVVITNLTGIPQFTLPVTVKSDTMWVGPYPQNYSNGNLQMQIPMQATCGTGGLKTLNFAYMVKYDSTCSNVKNLAMAACASNTINLHCAGPCPKGGATPTFFSLTRVNYGTVDNNNDGLPDASGSLDFTKIATHSVVNGDTVKGVWNIKINPNTDPTDAHNGQIFPNTYIDFDLGAVTYPGYLSAINSYLTALPNAQVTIYPAGGGAAINCTVTPTIVGTQAHYDFNTCHSPWANGDSMVVTALYTVNTALYANYNKYDAVIKYVTQNQVYSTYIPQTTPIAAPTINTYSCDSWNDYLNVMNLSVDVELYHSYNIPLNGCSSNIEVDLNQVVRGRNDGNLFPYEYRNFYIPKKLTIMLPHGFIYRPNSTTTDLYGAISDSHISQVGDTLFIDNLNTYTTPYGGTVVPADERTILHLYFSVNPTCSAVVGNLSGNIKADGIGNVVNTPSIYYSYQNYNGGVLVLSEQTKWQSDIPSGNPNQYTYTAPLPVLAGGGAVTTNTGIASWSIQMQNQSNTIDAPNSYLYITPANSFTNIVISEGGTPLVKTAAGFYQLGNLAASASRTFTVTGQLGSCSKDSFRIYQGWGCNGYPSSFTAGTCNPYTWLVASGYNAGLDATFNRVGTGDITLCNPPFSVEALINSTLTGNLGSDSLVVILPPFTSYASGTDSIGNYPTGTAYAATALNPTIKHAATGDTLIFALNTKTGGVGLTGVGDGTHSQVKVKFSIATQCGFTSGTPIKAVVSGVSVCGDRTAVVTKSTNAITLAGANPTDQFAITYTATSTPCTVTATVSIKNTGAAPTLANDSLIITLPAGALLAGATTNIHNAAGLVAATNSSASVYKWPVPTGMAVNDSMTFSFPIDLTQVACGPQISTANAIQNVSLSCNGNACLTPVIVGGKDATIIVTKPTLVINNIVAQNINGWPSGGSGTLAVTLTNTSTVDVPASTYNVEYFCGSSTTPMAAALFPAAVPAGATVTANMSVIASSTCLPGTMVTGKIRPVGAFGAVCLCNPSSFTMLAPLPVNLINLSASKLTTSQVKIGWQVGVELNLASYDVERSTDGSTFNKVNNTAATGRTNYSSLDNIAGVSSKNVYYRLKMINKDGTFKYSQIVKVNTEFTDMGMVIYPNPVRNQMLVTINSGITQKAELRLVNNLGQTLQTQQLNLVTGSNSVTVDNINRLPAAAYLVVVYFSNGDVQRAKVIKE